MLLDLHGFFSGNSARAHEHLEEDIAEGEGLGLMHEGREGGKGDVVGEFAGGGEGGEEGGVGSGCDVGGGDEEEGFTL